MSRVPSTEEVEFAIKECEFLDYDEIISRKELMQTIIYATCVPFVSIQRHALSTILDRKNRKPKYELGGKK